MPGLRPFKRVSPNQHLWGTHQMPGSVLEAGDTVQKRPVCLCLGLCPWPLVSRETGAGGWPAGVQVGPWSPGPFLTPSLRSIIKNPPLKPRSLPATRPFLFAGKPERAVCVQLYLRPLSTSLLGQIQSCILPHLSAEVRCLHLATRPGDLTPCSFLIGRTLLSWPQAPTSPIFCLPFWPSLVHLCQPLFPQQPQKAGKTPGLSQTFLPSLFTQVYLF